MFVLQPPYSYNIMLKKGKKKSQAIGDDPDVDIVSKMEIIYEDTKSLIGVEPEFKWGKIY